MVQTSPFSFKIQLTGLPQYLNNLIPKQHYIIQQMEQFTQYPKVI